MEKSELLNELEKQLKTASKSLKAAWKLCKHNGMDDTAKELADTVLDVDLAHQMASEKRDELYK